MDFELNKDNIKNYSNKQLVYLFNKHWTDPIIKFTEEYNVIPNVFKIFLKKYDGNQKGSTKNNMSSYDWCKYQKSFTYCVNAIKLYLTMIGIPKPMFYMKNKDPSNEEVEALFYNWKRTIVV